MEPSTWVAIVLGVLGTLNFWQAYLLTQKNKKIELLETKTEIQEKTIWKQELQITKLEITGTAATKFFQQLPNFTGQQNEESV
jgi:hypothetical protein